MTEKTASAPVTRSPLVPEAKPKRKRAEAGVIKPPEGDAFLAMMGKMMDAPDMSIEKIEAYFRARKEYGDNLDRKSFWEHYPAMQADLPVIERRGSIKNRQGQIQSRHALWEDVVEVITPILTDHGYVLTFRPKVMDGKISVVAILTYRSGHSERTDPYEVPADTSGSKNAVQAQGSSTSYGKRYTAFALLNIVSRGEDDDGDRGGGTTSDKISDEQLQQLIDLAEELDIDKRKFCEVYGYADLPSIQAKNFDEAKKAMWKKRKKVEA